MPLAVQSVSEDIDGRCAGVSEEFSSAFFFVESVLHRGNRGNHRSRSCRLPPYPKRAESSTVTAAEALLCAIIPGRCPVGA